MREYSALADKCSRGDSASEKPLGDLTAKIPKEILSNYLGTRKRNIKMHLGAITYLASKVIHYLALTLDDTAPYGLAAIDRRTLEAALDKALVWDRADVYPGADELPSALLARFAIEHSHRKEPIKAYFLYNSATGPLTTLIYEDRPLGDVLTAHRRAVGLVETTSPESADLIIAVNAAGKHQGEAFAQPNYEDVENANRHLPAFVDSIHSILEKGKQKVVILDVAYANGCDHRFMHLLMGKCDITKLAGISGWNTAGNSIGSGLALGVATFLGTNCRAIIEALYTRLVDDWIYQAGVRQEIYQKLGKPSVFHLGDKEAEAQKMVVEKLEPEMQKLWKERFEPNLKGWGLEIKKIFLPWPRLFSVTMDLNVIDKQ